MDEAIKLTEYSHGAGCGCKISPQVLDEILKTNLTKFNDSKLLVGNQTKDDAAVYDIGDDKGIISTTDFFMPIVDDPFTFGKIAATNAISDIYAMAGRPIMAIAILGWPINKLSANVAQKVIDGARSVCHEVKISLAGGHSIDAPEPIFGLAVTGIVHTAKLKRNDQAQDGDILFLTKPLGVGILTTAQKKKVLSEKDTNIAIDSMLKINTIGQQLAELNGVSAITDVTGFGLAGHLLEICRGSNLNALINFSKIPLLKQTLHYLSKGCSPGGAERNYSSYGKNINKMTHTQQAILCDPQTSGGLLVCVAKDSINDFLKITTEHGLELNAIGELTANNQSHTINLY